jgi:DNA-binding PadR family transcriptional regulator
MFAEAIYAAGGGRCASGHASYYEALRRAMSGGHCGPEGPPHGAHHRHHGFGRPKGFAFGDFVPGGGGRGRGRKARRGDIRTAALLLLAEEPRNGYQIMQEVEERSDGAWRPSPGSVYPALQQLEDEGLIRSQETDGRKLFELTDAGRAYVAERGEGKPAPWEQVGGDISDQAIALGKLMREVAAAFVQVMRAGSDAQMTQAREVLTTARRDLYRILADGDPQSDSGSEP